MRFQKICLRMMIKTYTIPPKLVSRRLFLPILSIKDEATAVPATTFFSGYLFAYVGTQWEHRRENKPKTFDAPTRALAATSDWIPALRNTDVE